MLVLLRLRCKRGFRFRRLELSLTQAREKEALEEVRISYNYPSNSTELGSSCNMVA
jgi:hypothetical protein